MQVKLIGSYPDESLAIRASGVCVGTQGTETGYNKALESGHLSILEHLPMAFEISGISRACSHQLVRHRHFSFSQQSQRYVTNKFTTNIANQAIDILYQSENTEVLELKKVLDEYFVFDLDKKNDNYIGRLRRNINSLGHAMIDYLTSIELGDAPEQARRILPNQTKTDLVISVNARSFVEACKLRICNMAQWEIRELFKLMREEIKDVYPTVYKMCKPDCNNCKETRPCERRK